MEMALALEADQGAPSPAPVAMEPTPLPAATLTPEQSMEMALALEADQAAPSPAQTVALHRWLYARALENAEAIGLLAQSDAYLEAVGLEAEKYQTRSGFRAQDYTTPTTMRLYTLNPEKASVSGEENAFVLAQIRRYISLEGASVGNRGENAVSEIIRPAARMTVTSAYAQPGGLADTVVTLDFDGDYSVCCVFTVYADGTVLCDAGLMLNDLPGDLFTRAGTYEGVALQLLKND